MKHQNYSNHIKVYPPHHLFFYPISLILLILTIREYVISPERHLLWGIIVSLVVLTTGLSFMLRQHYALGNQNRIVRLELRFRYYVLTGKRLDLLENNLSFKQIAALRFASDNELAALIDKTLAEKLEPADIKKSIKEWLPDYMRL